MSEGEASVTRCLLLRYVHSILFDFVAGMLANYHHNTRVLEATGRS